ncbi:hypothetical protein CFP71_10000 [Amycolatopsis thailandensis]|uniref:Uncharacterized protein n=1 Tax=Amycolatopsis thailandensis TaxID=589330 RepID=A0A229SDS8_9PSEU|nr:hypothetical protein [Amycolatopsis thailandensis]OXM57058.1 hypothetical protein CFP71_10000 [Amycolatopsis thailandensis]
MSIPGDASILASLASSQEIPIEVLTEAQNSLDGLRGKLVLILGTTSQRAIEIYGLIEAVKESLEDTKRVSKSLESAIHDAADYHSL